MGSNPNQHGEPGGPKTIAHTPKTFVRTKDLPAEAFVMDRIPASGRAVANAR